MNKRLMTAFVCSIAALAVGAFAPFIIAYIYMFNKSTGDPSPILLCSASFSLTMTVILAVSALSLIKISFEITREERIRRNLTRIFAFASLGELALAAFIVLFAAFIPAFTFY